MAKKNPITKGTKIPHIDKHILESTERLLAIHLANG
jgi:hypothetical protein